MRLLAVTVWAFVCVTLLGVLAYSVLLWSQYWRWASPRGTGVRPPVHRRRITRGSSNASLSGGVLQPHRMAPLPKDKILAKVEAYRVQLERQLRRAQWDSTRPVGAGGQPASNRYSVRPSSNKPRQFAPPRQLLARATALPMRMLQRDMEPFQRMGYGRYFPATDYYSSHFNSCALVSSAGSMLGSKLGPEIDGHETVLRFNDAPTAGYEDDVGGRTTIRLLNSQVLARPEFDFFNSVLYRNVTLVAWDPSREGQRLDKWLERPEFDLFPAYWLRREVLPDESFYLLHPHSVWEAWHFLDGENPGPVLRNPPSSGFLGNEGKGGLSILAGEHTGGRKTGRFQYTWGLLMLLKQCRHVDAYELVPSMRLTKRCHYYEVHEDLGCTLGDWHPLAAEKLLALHLAASGHALEQVFAKGRLPLSTLEDRWRGA